MFWVHAVEKSRARSILERFRHPGTYALLLLICALLSVALGEPRRAADASDRVWKVIIVDAGAAMQAPAADTGRSCLEQAVHRAQDEIGRLSARDHVAVIMANPWPRLVHHFDDSRPLASKRLAGMQAAESPAAVDAAVRLAGSLLYGRPNPQVVLVTNRTGASAFPPETPVRVVQVPTRAENEAILSAAFEPDRANPLRGRLVVRVGFWGARPREVTLEVKRAGGAPLLNETRTIAPGTTLDFVVAGLPADGDAVFIRLLPEDAVPADNRTTVRLPLRSPVRVGLVAYDAATASSGPGGVPMALLTALETDPAIRFVGEGEERDVDVLAGIPRQVAERPSVVVVRSGPVVADGEPIVPVRGSSLTEGLDFEGGLSGNGVSLKPAAESTASRPDGRGIGEAGMTALLLAGDAVVAAASGSWATGSPNTFATEARGKAPASSQAGAACLFLSTALLADDSTANRRAAFSVFVARAVRALAGWEDGPVVLPPTRALEDPLWPERFGLAISPAVMPGSREESALQDGETSVAPSSAAASPPWRLVLEPFEVLLLGAMVLFLVEAMLHTRGRIP